MAYFDVGRILRRSGSDESALQYLLAAKQQFQQLSNNGSIEARSMFAIVLLDIGDSFQNLGQLDEAQSNYEAATRLFENLKDDRGVAIAKGQTGLIYLRQQYYDAALRIYNEVLSIFRDLQEPQSIAGIYYQIGLIHRFTGNLDQAEQSLRESLALRVQHQLVVDEAGSLDELGNIYNAMGRLGEATDFYRQAAEIFSRHGLILKEGVTRSNLASAMIKLQRYDDARRELLRSLECKQSYSQATELWKTWELVRQLEEATGNPQAAAQARQHVIESYSAYRRAGGVSQSNVSQLYTLTLEAIQQNKSTEIEQQFVQLLQPETPQWGKVLITKLQAILRGDRNPTLADDPALDFWSAAELQLLLEALNGAAS